MNSTTPSGQEQAKHFVGLLKQFHNAMLVTHSAGEGFHARPMAMAEVEDDGRVWFITHASSPKVREIAMDAEVYITAQSNNAFLSLSGRASLLGDREKIAQLWQESYKVWFPKGQEDPDIELIAVRPERGEYWDTTAMKGLEYLWETTKAYVTGTTPEIDEGRLHGTVRL